MTHALGAESFDAEILQLRRCGTVVAVEPEVCERLADVVWPHQARGSWFPARDGAL